MRKDLRRLLGIELPIVQAPMGGVGGPALAGAVSNAGGLGMLAPWSLDIDALKSRIVETRAITAKPFGVNLNLNWPQEERLAATLAEGVGIVSFFWGDPAPYVARVHAAGAIAMQTVSSAAEAKRAVDNGIDLIVAQGWEAGGHVRGTVATMALVPAVVDAVGDIPVIAAGGIADGRGLAAALALGASGAWIGTRFLASAEAGIHSEYQRRLLAADETSTVHTELFDVGWPSAPHRVLRNSTYDAWVAAGSPSSGHRPGEGEVIATSATRGPTVRYRASTPVGDTVGNVEALSLWAGQGVALVSHVQPAAEIVRQIADEARAAVSRLESAL